MGIRKTSALITLVFIVALVAGGAAGMLLTRYLAAPKPAPTSADLTLSEELQLRPGQREQIRQIWESVRTVNDKSYADAEMLQHLEDDAIMKILTPDQQKDFARIHQEYRDRFDAMKAKRETAFREAVAKTKQVLDADQRRRYEQILARRLGSDPAVGAPAATQPAGPSSSFTFSSPTGPVGSPG